MVVNEPTPDRQDGRTAATWCGTRPISDEQAAAWVAKGHRHAAAMLELAGPVADPAAVLPCRVEASDDWIFGNFMVAWLDYGVEPRRVRHLPDAAFFLELLRIAYAPVLESRPDLAALLTDTSRPEMSLTNDVLQIQLAGLQEGYSMIRHHALMLFFAALWLDEPRRSQWLDLYDQLAGHVDERPEGRPSLQELAEAETRAFADFRTLAPRTLTADAAQALLASPDELRSIVDYQLYAGAAIGLLWREYRAVPEAEREAWQREQLSNGYLRLDYLEQNWTDHK
jgi:hypothetical protein